MPILTIKIDTSEMDAFQQGFDAWFGLGKNPYKAGTALFVMWDLGHSRACESEEAHLDSLSKRKA